VFKALAPPSVYALSLHDALPISAVSPDAHDADHARAPWAPAAPAARSASAPASTAPCTARAMSAPTRVAGPANGTPPPGSAATRSEEHTSELQSRVELVCRLQRE